MNIRFKIRFNIFKNVNSWNYYHSYIFILFDMNLFYNLKKLLNTMNNKIIKLLNKNINYLDCKVNLIILKMMISSINFNSICIFL